MSKVVNPRISPARSGTRPTQSVGAVVVTGLRLEQASQPGPTASSAPTPVLQQAALFV